MEKARNVVLFLTVIGLLGGSASAVLITNQTTGQTLFYDDFERVGDPVGGTRPENAWPGSWENITPANPGSNQFKVYKDPSVYQGNNHAYNQGLSGDPYISNAHLSSVQGNIGDKIRVEVALKSRSPQAGIAGMDFQLRDSGGSTIWSLTANDDGSTGTGDPKPVYWDTFSGGWSDSGLTVGYGQWSEYVVEYTVGDSYFNLWVGGTPSPHNGGGLSCDNGGSNDVGYLHFGISDGQYWIDATGGAPLNAVTGNWANVEADSSISQNWGFSTGAWENANVYRDGSNTTRGLLRLSLSEAAASDGKLRLYDVLDPVGNPDMTGETFDVYLMSAANDDWSEAEGKWSEKASGVPWDGGSHESGMSLISTYTFSGSSLPETIEVDIAQAVINDVVANRGGDMSLLLVGWDDPGDGTHGFQFNTKENTANPASARLMYYTPEPATLAVLAFGLLLGLIRRR